MRVIVIGRRCEVVGESAGHFFFEGKQLFAAKDIKRDRRKLSLLDLATEDKTTYHQALKLVHFHTPSLSKVQIHQHARQYACFPQKTLLR